MAIFNGLLMIRKLLNFPVREAEHILQRMGFILKASNIFPRDNARVGAQLNFTYEIKGDDWHHKGKNSKGGPMYEIWAVRK